MASYELVCRVLREEKSWVIEANQSLLFAKSIDIPSLGHLYYLPPVSSFRDEHMPENLIRAGF